LQQQKYKKKLTWYTTIQMKYITDDQTHYQIRECNHTISQFPILAIGKSRSSKDGGGEAGTQTELG